MKIMKLLKFCAFASLALIPFSSVLALDYPVDLNQPAVLGASTGQYVSGSLVNDHGTIYFISGSLKVPFTSLAAFKGFGYSLKNVAKGDLSGYTLSTDYVISTANAVHPWGSWVIYKGAVYNSTQEGMIGVPSAAVFFSNGGKWAWVVKANKYDIAALQSNPNLPPLTENDARLSGQSGLSFAGGGQNTNSSPTPTPTPSPTGSSAPISLIPQIILPPTVYASTSATFSVTSGDPYPPLSYTFNWGDTTTPNSLTVNSASHVYYAVGPYILTISVSDGRGNSNIATSTVNVALPPKIKPSIPSISAPATAAVGTSVTVTTSASDPQGLALSYVISWGDNSADTIPASNSATHTYNSSDSFIIKVTVTNSQGQTNSNSVYIYITPSGG